MIFESRYGIGSIVKLESIYGDHKPIHGCIISGVCFYLDKVKYKVQLPAGESWFGISVEVDSKYISDNSTEETNEKEEVCEVITLKNDS